ncbi:MAG: DUF3667 domain-containing protein [Chitinophagaceae bacterium]
MSHSTLRKEKDCLNCGTIVQGRYCHVCGQENLVPHDTFWHMVRHFVYDITHFDGNFFATLRNLIARPGFLSREYANGRRARYLHPVKMYVFTSAMFFLLFFSFFDGGNSFKTNLDIPLSAGERKLYIQKLEDRLKTDSQNTILISKLAEARDSAKIIRTRDQFVLEEPNANIISFTGSHYSNIQAYDSVQQALPSGKRDGWLKRRIHHKEIEINEKFRTNPGAAINKLSDTALHRLPYMLFISLPLFAGILKLVYFRRKKFFYSDHGIFTIHLYIFSFILLLGIFLFGKLNEVTGWDVWNILILVLFGGMIFYLYKAMHNFYGQGKAKTFLKFLLVSLLSLVMMLVLFLLLFFFSAFTF